MKALVVCLSVLCALASNGSARPSSHYSMGPARHFDPVAGNELNEVSFSNGFVVDTRTGVSAIPPELALSEHQPGPAYHIIQFNGPIRPEWYQELRRIDVRPFGYLPSYAVLAKLEPAQKAAVQALPMVHWVGLFQPAYKLQDVLLSASGSVKLVIVVTPGEEHRPILQVLADQGAAYADVVESEFCTSITVTVPASAIPAIARLQEVIWVQLWTEPELCNNNCQWVVQTGWQSTAPPDTSMTARKVWAKGVRGQRVILSTTDTGLNLGHNLFRDPNLSVTAPGIWPTHRKVVAFKLYQGAQQGETPYHGSHVNGTVAGDDSVTGGTSYYDGMSIKGRLYFVDLTNSSGTFVISDDLTPLWDSVYLGRGLPDSLRPIRQHSGSWGWSNSSGTYLLMDASTDNYSWVYKDFLNIMAAGNETSTRRIRNPGIAKNVITVGATQNGTSSNAIASFSSRGPTADNRLKPTVCAPGVNLYSATSSGTNTYQQMSGTSMATPAVNGTVGLMRCYLREGYYPTGTANPADSISYISAALLRSMAVASADPNIGSYVVPSFDIGWGRIDADSVLYFAGDTRKLIIKDDTSGVSTGQYKEEQFVVNSSIPLRVALAWTDTAAAPSASRTLVNNLNLEVIAPGGTVYRGNQYSGGQSTPNPTVWDTLNVEECVRVNSPATGVWTIRVYGFQVATSARQPFAWTITGDVSRQVGDVGVRRIIVPTGTIDSTQSVVPACTVYNYGSSTVDYQVRMRIGSSYNQIAAITAHAPGTARYVTFLAGSNWPRGIQVVRCSTELPGDIAPANDRDTGSVLVRVLDAEAVSINVPTGTVDSGAVIAPQATVRNNGTQAATFNVRFDIGSGYSNTQTVTNLAAGASQAVNFASWTALQRGTLATRCTTMLTGDMVPANNIATGNVFVRVLDAEAVSINAPTGTVDSGAVIAPQATVRNNGTQAATFNVRLNIGSGYSNTQTVTNLAAGASQAVNFASWTALQRGALATRCTTMLAADMVAANDTVLGTVYVAVRDVGVTQIVSPSGMVPPGPTMPAAVVHNYGTQRDPVRLFFAINSSPAYLESLDLPLGLPSGVDTTATFPNWDAWTGSYTAVCRSRMSGDQVPANDSLAQAFTVGRVDVGVSAINSPVGSVDTGAVVVPAATVRNQGNFAAAPTVFFRILDQANSVIYSSSRTVTSLAPGSSVMVGFDTLPKPHDPGSYTTRCSTSVAYDGNPANDTLTGQFSFITGPPPPPWLERARLPLAAKAGAFVVGEPATMKVYAAAGGKTADFYAYDPVGDSWSARRPIPAGVENKLVGKGANACADGNGLVYMVKGNNTQGFYRYDAAHDSWSALEPVPLGTSNRRVKGGADVAYAQGKVYLVKGDKNEFYRYDPVSDSWTPLASIPAPVLKLGPGSFAVYDDDRTVFVHQAKYHVLFAYDIIDDAWGPNRPGMPLIGRLGKSKKSKDGAAGAWLHDGVYALKGGNTTELWKYLAAADSWQEQEAMPELGSTGKKKKVKLGGDITPYVSGRSGMCFALKGNKTQEFWMYTPGSTVLPLATGRAARSGVLASAFDRRPAGFTITPNPLRSGFATLCWDMTQVPGISDRVPSISIYDASGRRVLRSSFGIRTSSLPLDLRGLSAGVYTVRLNAGVYSVSQKLVLQR